MDIVLIGAFSEMLELCLECGFQSISYVDENQLDAFVGYDYLGNDACFLKSIGTESTKSVVFVPDSPLIRTKLYSLYQINSQILYPQIISPHAKVSLSSKIEKGSVIQWGVHMSSNCVIGSFVKMNVMSNIMHDCNIGDFTTIAPNVAIMGRVSIGNRCYIGAHSTLLPEVCVCDDVIIGAGAVVTRNITKSGTYVGIPAVLIKHA